MRKGIHEYSGRFAREILQAVLDGLPPMLGESTMNLQYKAGNNEAIEFMHSQLKKAIADLSK